VDGSANLIAVELLSNSRDEFIKRKAESEFHGWDAEHARPKSAQQAIM
jgi:hypothetical protein